jgi:hypothetical protein
MDAGDLDSPARELDTLSRPLWQVAQMGRTETGEGRVRAVGKVAEVDSEARKVMDGESAGREQGAVRLGTVSVSGSVSS